MRKFIIASVCILGLFGCGSGGDSPGPMQNETITLSISEAMKATGPYYVSPDDVAFLLDGKSLARKSCSLLPGCNTHNAPVELSVTLASTRGMHTLDVQLLHQSCDLLACNGTQGYSASGNVAVTSSKGTSQQIPLAQQTKQMVDGDKISFSINVNP